MPCYDPQDKIQAKDDSDQRKFLEAALCGLINAMKRGGTLRMVLSEFKAVESGITEKQLLAWFKEHSKRDLHPNPPTT